MQLKDRINALVQLGEKMTPQNDALQAIVRRTALGNGWFTEDNQWKAISEIKNAFLDGIKLENWTNKYDFKKDTPSVKEAKIHKIALILAGNIPLVGFHDILCVFISGHVAKIKLSEKDLFVIPFLIKNLIEIDERCQNYFDITEGKMQDFDAVIATGSNNSARYFETYFGKYPNIIRKNRNAVAILRGYETASDLRLLGEDIFTYFGLGCRNVSKIYVPRGYDFKPLLEELHTFNKLVLNDKYKNNFDYQFTLLILNKVKYEGNGCILMTENTSIASPIAGLYYEYYDDVEVLKQHLRENKDAIQCVVSKERVGEMPSFYFGEAQKPSIEDYADGVDTLQFLLNL